VLERDRYLLSGAGQAALITGDMIAELDDRDGSDKALKQIRASVAR